MKHMEPLGDWMFVGTRSVSSPSGKTQVWSIFDRSGGLLGTVSWFGRWRCYAFNPALAKTRLIGGGIASRFLELTASVWLRMRSKQGQQAGVQMVLVNSFLFTLALAVVLVAAVGIVAALIWCIFDLMFWLEKQSRWKLLSILAVALFVFLWTGVYLEMSGG